MAGPQQIGLKAVFDLGDFASNIDTYLASVQKVENANSSVMSSSFQMGSAVSAGIGAAIGTAAVQALGQAASAVAGLGQAVFDTLGFFEQLTLSLETLLAIQGKDAGVFDSVAQGLQNDSQAAQEYLLWIQQLAIFSPFTTEQIANANLILQTYRFTAQQAAGLTTILVDYASAAGKSSDQVDAIASAVGRIRTEGHLLARDAQQLIRAGIPIYDFLQQATGKTVQDLLDLQEKGLLPAQTVIEAMVAGLDDFSGSGKRVSGTIKGLFSSLEDIKQIGSKDLFAGIFEGVRPALQDLVNFLTTTDVRATFIVLGQEVGKVFKGIIDTVGSGVNAVITAFKGLSPSVLESAAVFAIAATSITSFIGVAGLLSLAIGVLTNPFVLAIAAVSAFATVYIENWQAIQRISDRTTAFVVGVVNSIGGAFNTLANTVGSALSDASSYIATFSQDVTSWGSNIIGSLAQGITDGANLIIGAINTIGTIISGLMQPGSPPKFLPDLDKWGTESAQVYLDAWSLASFDSINQFGSTIGGLLKSMAGAGKITELSVPEILGGAREAYAKAVDQIEKTGKVSEDALQKVKNAAGPAGDAAKQILVGYANLFNATKQVETAQDKLNAVTKKYKDIITPIREEMDKISELRQQLSENNEILSLQRLLARGGVQESLRAEAQARINEINQSRKLRGLESEQKKAGDTAQSELDAAKKVQDEAQKQSDAIDKRIQAQVDSNKLLEDDLRIREQIRKEEERLAKEAERLRQEQLAKQLKIAELFQAELKDTVAVFKDQYVLADATSTEYEKQNALLDLQAVLGRRIVRDDQAKQLGVPESELDRLRKIPVTLEDANIKVKAAVTEMGDSIAGLKTIDLTTPFEEMQKSIDKVKISFDNAKKSLDDFVTNLDNALPSFLKLKSQTGETAPILNTLGSALAGLGAGFATSSLIDLLTSLPAIIGAINPISAAIILVVSGLAAAYAGNWFGIREATTSGVQWVQDKMGELAKSTVWTDITTQVGAAKDSFVGFFTKGGLQDFINGNDTLKSIADTITGTLLPAFDQLIKLGGDVFGPIFAPLSSGFSVAGIIGVFNNINTIAQQGLSVLGTIVSDAFHNLVDLVVGESPKVAQAIIDFIPTIPTRLVAGLATILATVIDWYRTFVPQIIAQGLLLGAAFLNWLGPLAAKAIVGLGVFIGQVLRWIIGTGVPALFKGALFLAEALLGFLKFAVVDFPPLLTQFFGRFVAWMISDGVPMLLEAGSKLGVAMLQFASVAIQNIGPALKIFTAAVGTFFTTYIGPALYQAAVAIGGGILQGLYDAFGQDNVDAFLGSVQTAFDAIVNVFNVVVANVQIVINAIILVGTLIGSVFGTVIDLAGAFLSVVGGQFSLAGALIGSVFGTISDVVGPILTYLGDGFNLLGALIGSVASTIEAVVMAAITNVTTFFSAVGGVFDAAWNVISVTIAGDVVAFGSLVVGFIATFLSDVAQGAAVVISALTPVLNTALKMFDGVVSYFTQVEDSFNQVITYLGTLVLTFVTIASQLFSSITTTVSDLYTEISTEISTWGTNLTADITGFVSGIYAAALSIGTNIVNGVIDGIESLVDGPKKALSDLLHSLMGSGQDDIEAHSPSELAARILGNPIAAGIVKGINDFDPAAAFRGLVGKAVDVFGGLGQGTTDKTKDLTDDNATLISSFSGGVVDTFTSMTTAVVAQLGDLAEQSKGVVTLLLTDLNNDFIAFVGYIQDEQTALQSGMISSLSSFGSVLAATMTSVVNQSITAFQALRPAIVSEIGTMSTDVQTLIQTPDTGFQSLMVSVFSVSGEAIGKALSDGIVAGFVANETAMILGLEDSLSRVLSTMSSDLSSTGQSTATTSAFTSSRFDSNPSNILPSNVSNINRNNHYHLSVRSEANSQGIIQDYGIMQTLAFDGT